MGTPRASKTSAAPHCEVTARLPCLATLAPAAEATSAAPQEMLKVCGPPPPVPTQSTSSALSSSVKGMGTECLRMTSTKPASSGACSPRVANTATMAAISTSGTLPARISSSTSAACSRVSAVPTSASWAKQFLHQRHEKSMAEPGLGREKPKDGARFPAPNAQYAFGMAHRAASWSGSSTNVEWVCSPMGCKGAGESQ